jgi:hypothetical protein
MILLHFIAQKSAHFYIKIDVCVKNTVRSFLKQFEPLYTECLATSSMK